MALPLRFRQLGSTETGYIEPWNAVIALEPRIPSGGKLVANFAHFPMLEIFHRFYILQYLVNSQFLSVRC